MSKFQADQSGFQDEDPASYLKPHNKRFGAAARKTDDDENAEAKSSLDPLN